MCSLCYFQRCKWSYLRCSETPGSLCIQMRSLCYFQWCKWSYLLCSETLGGLHIQMRSLCYFQWCKRSYLSALRHLEACLGSRPLPLKLFGDRPGLNHGLLLLTGPKGSGKTSLAAALCQAMSRAPTLAYTLTVDCKPLRGEGTHRGLVTTTVHASRSSTALLFLKLW